MKSLLIATSVGEFVKMTNCWLSNTMLEHKARSMYLPAGKTPRPIYANWRESPHNALKNLSLYQLDEILEGEHKGAFAADLREALPDLTVHEPKEWEFHQADLGILGLGWNGHVAFHEPHVHKELKFGKVYLSDETARNLGVAPHTQVMTYGLGAFMETKALLLIMDKEKYEKVFVRCFRGDGTLPATRLLEHKNLTILVHM
jgi:6-phosphogluconolactonase/glucosamine-6-phosphate isomerase/deaminase